MEIIEGSENEKKGYISKLGTKFPNENKLWENPFLHKKSCEWYKPNDWVPEKLSTVESVPEKLSTIESVPEKLSTIESVPEKPGTIESFTEPPRKNGIFIGVIICILFVLLCYILS